jgi:HEPN domain-containing protein
MNNVEKYEHWEDIAQYDLDTAKAMFQSGRYLYVVFMCQQAIEKLTKGLYVLYKNEEAPRTHNIYTIFKSIFDNQDKNEHFVQKEKAKEVLDLAEEVFSWLKSLKK